MASYNQLAQLQSADTQNQLAQMQMQEARQLAPYRMQEQQSRAATAKLTLDDAIEAQTYIKTVMAKAAEASGGSAPTNPFEAAKQMMNYPNAQVQAAGLRLLESFQKLQAYEQQAQFLKDESVVPVAPAGLPAVTAPSIGSVTAPMVAPGTSAPNVASALSRFVSGTKDMPDGSVGPYFSIGGQPVSEEQYLSGREAIMLPPPVNALAPAVAAAPAVNAMIPAVASALQNADALKKEIEKGDRTYGKAPGWTSKRELLVEAYKQALKPGAVGTKSEFERLLDESGLSDTEKQDMRKAKLAKETAKPADKVEAKSDFEKLLADSGLTEEQKQEMRKAKLAKETAKPAEKTEAKSDLAQLMSERAALVASGVALTDNRVVAYDNAIQKVSSPSAGQPSDVTRLITERNAAVARKAPPDEIAALNAAIKKATTPAQGTTVNVNASQKAEDVELGKYVVDQYKDISTRADVATRSLPALDINLKTLEKGFDTGFGTETIAAGAKVLAALGVQNAKDFATDSQTFLANANSAVLQKQLEQKGVQTAADADRITSTGAQLGNTKEANKFIISVAKAQLQRDIAQRKFYSDWRTENKTFKGAEDAWYAGPGGASLFDSPILKKYAEPVAGQAEARNAGLDKIFKKAP